MMPAQCLLTSLQEGEVARNKESSQWHLQGLNERMLTQNRRSKSALTVWFLPNADVCTVHLWTQLLQYPSGGAIGAYGPSDAAPHSAQCFLLSSSFSTTTSPRLCSHSSSLPRLGSSRPLGSSHGSSNAHLLQPQKLWQALQVQPARLRHDLQQRACNLGIALQLQQQGFNKALLGVAQHTSPPGLASGLQQGLHRALHSIAHRLADTERETGLQLHRRRAHRSLVRSLQRLAAVLGGCSWHHQGHNRGPMFASISLPFLRRRAPQGELMPVEKLRELFDELDQHSHGRLSIADFRVREACCP